ncbi:MAG TPA: TetR/AcrR family transcriptional regulator, partial [Lachnospiraceae bacterium]|nr:TetR/AcrR family transcriptional regulator [Lachnospiraceae bacterium]
MGKAFTQEEREELQEKLRRTGLKLLAENGIRNISIRQLTKEVGIAQGGFYTFYKDKDDFVE